MIVEILYLDGCPNAEPAERAVTAALASLSIHAEVHRTVVRTEDEAALLDFHGSPTIRVDGNDVDPPPAGTAASLTCRIYREGGQLRGTPSEARIRQSLLERNRT
ncbi:MAG TPA: hypothetical protein VMW73_02115 [Spirochaetia bacterium]|nr:hypothetical protein [Spirochaetia bacterium]